MHLRLLKKGRWEWRESVVCAFHSAASSMGWFGSNVVTWRHLVRHYVKVPTFIQLLLLLLLLSLLMLLLRLLLLSLILLSHITRGEKSTRKSFNTKKNFEIFFIQTKLTQYCYNCIQTGSPTANRFCVQDPCVP